ncbi:Phosphate-specific transport system accessory protein PhoU [BD1-7 clade bacterium]|uniref:Phosphate-specific transport system accessory protein PhoU n=1 Tax=BD1-7 clade bacterium TaxID=2029982 RepID=A0A5S9NKV6_9GAMM|nr:Phosphate-specific transport system accessory protein PhoU [BD1-7 clade bacterium]CAA0093620.1 Phosphate-specific transport system accessory protein PhoU [BD1-7 clade bacterium]
MESEGYTDHISRQFNEELDEVRSRTLEMGGLVESQVANAVHSLIELDVAKAEDVRAKDDAVNQMEIMIDEECARILARRQPAASDLRLVLMTTKIISDLERIGDESSKIALHAVGLAESGDETRGFIEIRHLGAHVGQMVHDALDAFARMDTQQALRVAQEDKKVDLEYGSALREMMSVMIEDPRSISRIINVIWALRSLERIGDHARNIAEHVVYLVKGQDVRHVGLTEMENRIQD